MNNMHELAIKIAQEIAPDEVDLAPAIIDAALKGGKQWDSLLKPAKGPELGGVFGGIEGGNLPLVIETIRICSSILASLLSIGAATLSIKISLRSIREKKKNNHLESQPEEKTEKNIEHALLLMINSLSKFGIQEERAERLSELTVQILLKNEQSSKELIAKLSKK